MVVCQYYMRGFCKYGASCWNEHPAKSGASFSSRNPFDSLAGGNSSRGGSAPQDTSSSRDRSKYALDKELITNDLSKERPLWILSSYGPGKDSPRQIFGGPLREQSFEELRLRHYDLASSGNQEQAIQEAQLLFKEAEQQIQAVLNDVGGAIRYVLDGAKEHPNRLDICNARGADPSQLNQPSGSLQPTSASDQSSVFGRRKSQTTVPQAAAPLFGRPSTSFGQPSLSGPSSSTPSFGPLGSKSEQPSSFGQPSTLGSFGEQAPILNTKAGQSSGQPLFGPPQSSPSILGGPSTSAFTQSNSFNSSATPLHSVSFGQPSLPATTSGFTPATLPAAPPGFGQPASAFGRPATSTGNFGQPTKTDLNPFASTKNSQPFTSFGKGPAAPPSTNQANPSATNSGPSGSSNAESLRNSKPNAQRDAQGKLISWKGKPVTYIDNEPCFQRSVDDWERIWFPDGAPVFTKIKEPPLEAYDEATKESYMYLMKHGRFKDGKMPHLPPRREWTNWDF